MWKGTRSCSLSVTFVLSTAVLQCMLCSYTPYVSLWLAVFYMHLAGGAGAHTDVGGHVHTVPASELYWVFHRHGRHCELQSNCNTYALINVARLTNVLCRHCNCTHLYAVYLNSSLYSFPLLLIWITPLTSWMESSFVNDGSLQNYVNVQLQEILQRHRREY